MGFFIYQTYQNTKTTSCSEETPLGTSGLQPLACNLQRYMLYLDNSKVTSGTIIYMHVAN